MVKKISIFLILFSVFVGFLCAGEGANPHAFSQQLIKQNSPENQYNPQRNGGAFFIRSLLIPGWGQKNLGANTAMRNFIISEVALIGKAIGFSTYRDWLQDDYQSFAAEHAGVTIANQDDDFWVDVGDYLSVNDFNDSQLRRRFRVLVRDPRSAEFWQWDELANAQQYRNMRVQSGKMKTWTQFAIAGIVTNHIVSALHALWLKRKLDREYETAAKESTPWRLAYQPLYHARGGTLNFSFQF